MHLWPAGGRSCISSGVASNVSFASFSIGRYLGRICVPPPLPLRRSLPSALLSTAGPRLLLIFWRIEGLGLSGEIIHLTSCSGNLFVTFWSGKTRTGVRAGPSLETPATQTLPIISIRTGRRRVALATPVSTTPPRPAACTPARPLPHPLARGLPQEDNFFCHSILAISSSTRFYLLLHLS